MTHEATDWMGLDLGPGGTLGVIAGLAVFEVGLVEGLGSAGSFVAGTVAGVATGAVANELIQHRPLFGPREGAGTTKSSLTPVDVLTPTSVMPKIWTAPLGSFVMRP